MKQTSGSEEKAAPTLTTTISIGIINLEQEQKNVSARNMLQPRRREAVRRPHNNGLIYTTLVVLLSVATFNYAVGLALAGQ